MRRFRSHLLFGVAGSVLLAAGAASAQSAAPTPQPQTSNLDEVVVTAQKRSERLLDVPMSISATSGEQLEAAGISSTGDLQQISPGLVTVNNGLSFTPAIRGVSSVGTSPGDETNVSIYLDDVYLGAPLAGLFDLKDIQRVEVLKGPQGTLFGRNATGGAIRIVTLPPSFTPRAEVSADYGFDFNEITLGAYVTGPLTDNIAGALNLYYTDNDGYIEGVGPNEGRRYGVNETFSTRGKLLFNLSDTLDVTVTADYSDRSDNAIFTLIPRNQRNANQATPGVILARPFEYAGGTQPAVKVESSGVSVDANWAPNDWLSIRSITAYRSADGYYRPDTDRTNLPIGALELPQYQDTFSQELTFSGPADGRWSWLGGLYFYHSKAGNPFFRSYSGDAPGGTVVADYRNEVITDSYAAFGELTWHVTDRLHLTAGGRYTTETKEFEFADIVRAAGLRTGGGKETWDSPTYRLVARYDFADDWNVYASASNGFKSGVFNAGSLPAIPVEPEKIDALEIGVKGRVAGITLTAAAFSYDYTNIQVQGQTFLPGGAWVITLSNAAQAKIEGFEVTASGNLTDKLSFDVGFSALPTAEYERFTTAQVLIPNPSGGNTSTTPYDASGSRIIRAPEFQGNVRLTYTDTVAKGELQATASYSYNDGFYWQPGNFSPEDNYSLLNGRIAWTDPAGRLTYTVWGTNLLDTEYSMYTASTAVGIADALAKPRQIGVGITARF
jgi:iron complex outermembrane receptor protein